MRGLLFLTYGQPQESAVFAGKLVKRKFEVKVVCCKVIYYAEENRIALQFID